MALDFGERISDTTTTTGTGPLTVSGTPPTGYNPVSTLPDGRGSYWEVQLADLSQVEVFYGVVGGSGTTISRDRVLSSTNSGALVNFSAGTKTVRNVPTAELVKLLAFQMHSLFGGI